MADATTPTLDLVKPAVGDPDGEDLWGEKLNANFDKLDLFALETNDTLSTLSAPTWDEVTGKPTEFPPSAHTHDIADVIDLQTTLDGKAALVHTHPWSQITATPATFPSDWDTMVDKPSTFAPSSHTHPQSEVTGLVTDLAAKEPTIAAGTSGQYWRGDKSWQTLDKAAVGLANVDNTSDANKPVSTAQATALAGKEPTIAAGTTAQYWRGDKTWQTLSAGITDAPADDGEYVRINNVWRKKGERKVFTGGAIAFTVPSGAVAVRFIGMALGSTASPAWGVQMRVSDDGSTFKSGATDYGYAGYIHYTGSGGYANLPQSAVSGMSLTSSTDSTAWPVHFEGNLMVARPATTMLFSGLVRGETYNSNAANLHMSYNTRIFVGSVATSALALAAVQFFPTANTLIAGSYIEVEWGY